MENTIQLHDKKFRIMIPAEQIDKAVDAVAQRINADYAGKETPLFLGILNGSFMFMSDLIKKIEFQNELSFVKLASYDGTCSTGCVKSLIGLNNPIEGRHVIIVEDIVDTGESIEHMIKELEARNPASVEVCTLFSNPGRTARRCRSSTAPWRSATSSSWVTGWTTTSWAAVSRIFT